MKSFTKELYKDQLSGQLLCVFYNISCLVIGELIKDLHDSSHLKNVNSRKKLCVFLCVCASVNEFDLFWQGMATMKSNIFLFFALIVRKA